MTLGLRLWLWLSATVHPSGVNPYIHHGLARYAVSWNSEQQEATRMAKDTMSSNTNTMSTATTTPRAFPFLNLSLA